MTDFARFRTTQTHKKCVLLLNFSTRIHQFRKGPTPTDHLYLTPRYRHLNSLLDPIPFVPINHTHNRVLIEFGWSYKQVSDIEDAERSIRHAGMRSGVRLESDVTLLC